MKLKGLIEKYLWIQALLAATSGGSGDKTLEGGTIDVFADLVVKAYRQRVK